jgi:hypothetical protein
VVGEEEGVDMERMVEGRTRVRGGRCLERRWEWEDIFVNASEDAVCV